MHVTARNPPRAQLYPRGPEAQHLPRYIVVWHQGPPQCGPPLPFKSHLLPFPDTLLPSQPGGVAVLNTSSLLPHVPFVLL